MPDPTPGCKAPAKALSAERALSGRFSHHPYWQQVGREVEVAKMTEVSTRPQVADDFCKECGYEPELKRTLGSFQVFAISFAFISVAVGIFGTYNYVLQNGGPVGIWLWPIVVGG